MSQLPLPIGLADYAVFASFLATGNEELVDLAMGIASGGVRDGCWIWGAEAAGKTHLLQAICERAGDRAAFVPLATLGMAGADMLQGLESRDIVCLDDLQHVAGDSDWERDLFVLYNELKQHDGQMVVAASMSPRKCPIALPDLASRLSQLPTYKLRPLGDENLLPALILRAGQRGLVLPEETAAYLLRRTRRDMKSLYALLDQLDREALRAQRNLTVPFVREILQELGTCAESP